MNKKQNLLLKDEVLTNTEDNADMDQNRLESLEEEEEYNRRTPKIIDEANKKNSKFQFKSVSKEEMDELIIEESKEESFIMEHMKGKSDEVLMQSNLK